MTSSQVKSWLVCMAMFLAVWILIVTLGKAYDAECFQEDKWTAEQRQALDEGYAEMDKLNKGGAK